MNAPMFTVIIPAYNRAALLRACLESVFRQSHKDFDVIVVDDGSTDETPAVLAEYADRVRAIRQENQGQATARNIGIAAARGQYLAFMDCDDVWFPWTLQTFHTIILTNNQPSIIMGHPLFFHNDSELETAQQEPAEASVFPDFLTALSAGHRFVGSCVLVVRRDAIGAIRFSQVRVNCEDLDFLMKLSIAPGYAWVLAPYTLGYRQHGSNSLKNIGFRAAGMKFFFNLERNIYYQGGPQRASERRRALLQWSHHLQCFASIQGSLRQAWELYRMRLPLLWQERSYKGLWEFPAFLARRPASWLKKSLLRKRTSPQPDHSKITR